MTQGATSMPERGEIRSEEVSEKISVVFKTPLPLFASVVNGWLCVAVMWHGLAAPLLLGWSFALTACSLARFWLWYAYRRRQPTASEARKWWGRWFTIGALATGCLWGAAASVVLLSDNVVYQGFVVMVLAGMAAGSVAADAPYLPAFYAFLLPAGAPLVLALLIRGDGPHASMSAMVLMFLITVATIGRGRRTRQIGLPRQYEPRDPHADARHHRHDKSSAAKPARRSPARARRARPRAHRRPADHHQRRPRRLEARRRTPRARGHRSRDRRGRAPSGGPHGAQSGGEEPGPARRHRRAGAPDLARRSDPDPTDPAEPGKQRDQVHRAGQHRHQGRLRGSPRTRGGAARRGRRHRHRHPRGGGRRPLHQIHAGRPEHRPAFRRHRARLGDLQAAGRSDGR